MFGVVYCADFYIQCERLFRPELAGRGLLITSSGRIGDGPIIASSNEARQLGLTPGLSGDQLVELFSQITSKQTITVCSPNYELYADLSSRLMKSLELLAPKVSAYANDEAVLALDNLKLLKHEVCEANSANSADSADYKVLQGYACEPNTPHNSPYHQYALNLKKTLKQWLGISVSIGIANTKTLAKLACDTAQTNDEYNSVIDLSTVSQRALILNRIAVADIAGISKKVANRLSQINIHTAQDLSQAPKSQVRRHSSTIAERIAIELSGLPCKTHQQSLTEDSIFILSKHIDAECFKQIKRELNSQVVSAVERLHSLSSNCQTVSVTLAISRLDKQDPTFENCLSGELAKPSDSAAAIRKLAMQLLDSVWRDGYRFHSLKFSLSSLSLSDGDQIGLFSTDDNSAALNSRETGPKSISFETVLLNQTSDTGQPKRSFLSHSFTTKWGDIARVS